MCNCRVRNPAPCWLGQAGQVSAFFVCQSCDGHCAFRRDVTVSQFESHDSHSHTATQWTAHAFNTDAGSVQRTSHWNAFIYRVCSSPVCQPSSSPLFIGLHCSGSPVCAESPSSPSLSSSPHHFNHHQHHHHHHITITTIPPPYLSSPSFSSPLS